MDPVIERHPEQLIGRACSHQPDHGGVDIGKPLPHGDINGIRCAFHERLEIFLALPDQLFAPGQFVILLPQLFLCGGELLIGRPELRLRLTFLHGLADLVRKLGKLCHRIPAFLDVEVHAGVDGLDNNLFPSPPGEQDERDGISRSSYLL